VRVSSISFLDELSTSSSTPSKSKLHRKHQRTESAFSQPGVQKLKASLRQTRRLLAKDNLAADVRVETERRLQASQADLARGEAAKKERGLATRYHKIKFFERQKVVRKLNQAKKRLALTLEKEDVDSSSKKEIEDTLTELRVDLNYIMHYPKSKKYISLFPPEVRQASGANFKQQTAESTTTAVDKEEIRTWIRTRMQSGELEVESEMHLDSGYKGGRNLQLREDTRMGYGWDGGKAEVKAGTKFGKGRLDVDMDTFFGDEDEDEDGHETGQMED